jgi:glycosyltransferase involved in cell wall biosynthesis
VVLCAASPDSPDIAKEVEEAIRRVMATRGRVIWIQEMVDRPTAVELYSHAAVSCCPSIYEPFGIINLEAMACETPVVASAVGGIQEVVVHGETGYLVALKQQREPPFEPVDPARFSRDLAAHRPAPARRRVAPRHGPAGRLRAESLFSWRAVAGRSWASTRPWSRMDREGHDDTTLSVRANRPSRG